jgi:orotate phosphoribosyltransferase
MRTLVIVYRQVPGERVDVYDRTWLALEQAAWSVGLRAWRFRSAEAGDEFIEFIEGIDEERGAPPAIQVLRRSLEGVAPAVSDRNWREAPPPDDGSGIGDGRVELLGLLREKSLRRGDFVLSGGARSEYYIDARPTTMSAAGQRLIGRLALARIDEQGWHPTAVGGLTLGADPVAYAIAHASAFTGRAIDAFTIRKEPKTHGTARLVEGNLSAVDNVVVVEDVMTSGKSALDAIRAIEAADARVLGVLAVVDREAGGARHLADAGHALTALFTARELLGT